MSAYIQYHNGGKLGWVPLDARPFVETELSICTRRPGVKKAVGGTVYLIAGLGKRRYYLWETFQIAEVEKEGADYCAWGHGWQLMPPARLEGEAFEAFRKACAYFIGFRSIDALPYRETLRQLAERHRTGDVTAEAERFCGELIDWNPGSGDLWYYRGVVRSRLGMEGAVGDLEAAIERRTEFSSEARQLLTALQAQRGMEKCNRGDL